MSNWSGRHLLTLVAVTVVGLATSTARAGDELISVSDADQVADVPLTDDELKTLRTIANSDKAVRDLLTAQKVFETVVKGASALPTGAASIAIKWNEQNAKAWAKINLGMQRVERAEVCDSIELELIDVKPSRPVFEALAQARGCHWVPETPPPGEVGLKQPLAVEYPQTIRAGRPIVEFAQRGAGAVVARGVQMPDGHVTFVAMAGWWPVNHELVRVDLVATKAGDRAQLAGTDSIADTTFRVDVTESQSVMTGMLMAAWSETGNTPYAYSNAWVVDRAAQNLGLHTNPYSDRSATARRPVADVGYLQKNNARVTALEFDKSESARFTTVRTADAAWIRSQRDYRSSVQSDRDSGTGHPDHPGGFGGNGSGGTGSGAGGWAPGGATPGTGGNVEQGSEGKAQCGDLFVICHEVK